MFNDQNNQKHARINVDMEMISERYKVDINQARHPSGLINVFSNSYSATERNAVTIAWISDSWRKLKVTDQSGCIGNIPVISATITLCKMP